MLTIDSIQGVTSEESIVVMPRGSDLVDAFRGYTAASRHRGRSYIVCSEAAERAALERRRPIGASRTVTEDEIWDRIAVNLTREPAAVTRDHAGGRCESGADIGAANPASGTGTHRGMREARPSPGEPAAWHGTWTGSRADGSVGKTSGWTGDPSAR